MVFIKDDPIAVSACSSTSRPASWPTTSRMTDKPISIGGARLAQINRVDRMLSAISRSPRQFTAFYQIGRRTRQDGPSATKLIQSSATPRMQLTLAGGRPIGWVGWRRVGSMRDCGRSAAGVCCRTAAARRGHSSSHRKMKNDWTRDPFISPEAHYQFAVQRLHQSPATAHGFDAGRPVVRSVASDSDRARPLPRGTRPVSTERIAGDAATILGERSHARESRADHGRPASRHC